MSVSATSETLLPEHREVISAGFGVPLIKTFGSTEGLVGASAPDAEELVFNEITTGAANDLEKVTHTAKQMIMRYGMSEKLGPRVLGRNQDMPFLGREMASEPDYSEEIAREIDSEINRVIELAHTTALKVLEEHLEELHRLSAILVERETIDKDQFIKLLAGAAEEEVFPEEASEVEPAKPKTDERRKRVPKPKPFPLPGQAMQPPDPEGAQS